ncbi:MULTISPECIES: hypothetical protein [Streptomyces]|nr:hypothetical protein [Streptomyces venezuelae]YP_010754261.1 NUDIX hydrolase [Streptomyces phage Chymera]AMS01608.1 NUDIX hydrolase [Streptomyces phage Chymera]APE22026.1 hypothetical protein vnz_14025 [Streptomyces venezuelae]
MFPTLIHTPGLRRFTYDVDAERQAQIARFGEQRHPDGTGRPGYAEKANTAREACQMDAVIADGGPRWSLILLKAVHEALAESDPARLRAELVQVAAVCAAWASDMDQRSAGTSEAEAVAAASVKLREILAPGSAAEQQATAAYAAALDQGAAAHPSDVEATRAHIASLSEDLTEQEQRRLASVAAAIYEWNNPNRPWDAAHPHDRICYSGDAYAALTALRVPEPAGSYAIGFRLHPGRGAPLDGALLPSGRCLVVEDVEGGLITGAASVDDLVRGHPDARVEWPEQDTVTRVRAWCDDLDASVRLQHGAPQAEHPHAVALRAIIDPQESP